MWLLVLVVREKLKIVRFRGEKGSRTDGSNQLHAADEYSAEVITHDDGIRVLVREVGCQAVERVLKFWIYFGKKL